METNGRTNGKRGLAEIDRHIWVMSAVFVSGAIMSILDTTIVNVALDTLARDFHSSISTIQWVVTGYMLALATVIPLSGWAVERFGSKRVWTTSLALFVLGSALSGAAWSAGSLIAFRVLQGFGGGMIMPVGMTMLTRAAGPQRVGRVMSLVGVPMLLGPVLGPVLGGLLVGVNWRWIFYVNVPIGIAAIAMALRLLPAERHDHAQKLDLRGFLLLSPGLGALVYGLAQVASKGGFKSAPDVISLVVGIGLIGAFIVHALRVKDRTPLLDLRLFKNTRFSAAAATTACLGAALFGVMILYPLYYQLVRGQSALDAGLLLAPQGLGAAAIMPIAGALSDRKGAGPIVLIGLVLTVVSSLAFVGLTADTSYAFLVAALFVRGIGLGMTMMPAMSAAFQTLSPEAVPRATSSLNIIQRVGGSIGTAVLAVILEQNIASSVPGSGGSISSAGHAGAIPASVAGQLADAFSQTFWVATAITAAAVIPALFLLKSGPTGDAAGDSPSLSPSEREAERVEEAMVLLD